MQSANPHTRPEILQALAGVEAEVRRLFGRGPERYSVRIASAATS